MLTKDPFQAEEPGSTSWRQRWAQKNEDNPGRENILSKTMAVGNHQAHK